MANRPCKADADVKRIWQLLLPDTPFPACGAQENADADAGERAPPPPRDNARRGENFRAAAAMAREHPRSLKKSQPG